MLLHWRMTGAAPPLVSIVIPAYVATTRQADLLAETLDTVAAQSCRDFETVVVDDGSPRSVDRIAAGRPGTTVLRQANGGSARARNTGIAASRGRYLIFLDADDHLLPRAIEAGLEGFTQHPECGFVVGGREEMTYEGDPVPWSVPAMPRVSRLYEILLAFDWYIIPPSSAMFRREVVDAVGGFRDPWGADDLDFYLRVARHALGWCYETPAVTRYRRYSASSSRDGERMLHSLRVVYDRQREVVRGDPALEAAFQHGLDRLTAIFTDCLVENVGDRLRARQWRRAARSAALLARESPRRLAALAGQVLRSAGRRGISRRPS
jgi:glycosyltransferase involved in cell wall biosynthesis